MHSANITHGKAVSLAPGETLLHLLQLCVAALRWEGKQEKQERYVQST